MHLQVTYVSADPCDFDDTGNKTGGTGIYTQSLGYKIPDGFSDVLSVLGVPDTYSSIRILTVFKGVVINIEKIGMILFGNIEIYSGGVHLQQRVMVVKSITIIIFQ